MEWNKVNQLTKIKILLFITGISIFSLGLCEWVSRGVVLPYSEGGFYEFCDPAPTDGYLKWITCHWDIDLTLSLFLLLGPMLIGFSFFGNPFKRLLKK